MSVDEQATVNAIRRHEERLQRDPASLAFAQLADLYRKSGRTQEAIGLCRSGLARYPHYTTARLILVKALIDEDRLAEALTELTEALESSPRDVQSHRLAAEIHRRQGHLDEAVRHLETAARLDPGDRESRALLGLLRAGGPTAEAGGLGRALADETFVTVNFGNVCLDQGLVEEAAQVFSRLVRKNPTDTQARERLEHALRVRLRRRG
jgi:tetratricopeptide (TPR) repeat protein